MMNPEKNKGNNKSEFAKISRMRDMCCTGGKRFSDCTAMMKSVISIMRNNSNKSTNEVNKKSEERKK